MTAARIALAAVLVGIGCEPEKSLPPPSATYAISFADGELTTGVPVISVVLRLGTEDVTLQPTDQIALELRTTTWPELSPVSTAQRTSIIPGIGQTPSGAQGEGDRGQIDVELAAAEDPTRWYAVAIPSVPRGFRWQNESALFSFTDGSKGVRFSPEHAPVVASLMACVKTNDTTRVELRFSEPVTKSPDAVGLQYGDPSESCTIAEDTPQAVWFDCAGSNANALLTASATGSITSEASGRPLTTASIRSDAMQKSTAPDGCVVHRTIVVD